MEKQPTSSMVSVWWWVVLCFFGVLFVLFGLFIPVLDDLCGPTADKELQNTAPAIFWTCVAIPVLLGIFLMSYGLYQVRKARVCNHDSSA
jgi:hypothetical protein